MLDTEQHFMAGTLVLESEFTRNLNFDNPINAFALVQTRKAFFSQEFRENCLEIPSVPDFLFTELRSDDERLLKKNCCKYLLYI